MERKQREEEYHKIEQQCAKLYKINNDNDDIFKLIENGLQLANENNDIDYALFFESEKASYQNNNSLAEQKLKESLKINQNDFFLYRNLGVVVSKLGREVEAIELYNKALSLNPDDYHSYRNKGVSLSILDRVDEAIELYNKALTLNPNDYDSYRNKGVSLSKLGREVEAIELYNKEIGRAHV